MFQSLFGKSPEDQDNTKHRVYVNVYDMIRPNYLTFIGYYGLGVGIFHSGVEVRGREYCFGGHDMPNMTGVFVIEPKIGIPELLFKRSIDMGTTDLTDKEVEDTLLQLSEEFAGNSYNLLTRNCNHFTEEFVKRLTGGSVPAWINRAARLGNMFPCVVPWEWIEPPELAEELEEDDDDGDSLPGPRRVSSASDFERGSRRSSTVSLLSSRNPRSNYTYNTNEAHSSQERLMGSHVSNFQGIILPRKESNS
ncbi:DUF862-domain-containing protein, partial [Backusella circina FSU 941]